MGNIQLPEAHLQPREGAPRTHRGAHEVAFQKGKEICLKMLAASVLVCICTVTLQRLPVETFGFVCILPYHLMSCKAHL